MVRGMRARRIDPDCGDPAPGYSAAAPGVNAMNSRARGIRRVWRADREPLVEVRVCYQFETLLNLT